MGPCWVVPIIRDAARRRGLTDETVGAHEEHSAGRLWLRLRTAPIRGGHLGTSVRATDRWIAPMAGRKRLSSKGGWISPCIPSASFGCIASSSATESTRPLIPISAPRPIQSRVAVGAGRALPGAVVAGVHMVAVVAGITGAPRRPRNAYWPKRSWWPRCREHCRRRSRTSGDCGFSG
jgi:hypothetical protein